MGVTTQLVKVVKLGKTIELNLKKVEGVADAKPARLSFTVVARGER